MLDQKKFHTTFLKIVDLLDRTYRECVIETHEQAYPDVGAIPPYEFDLEQ